jgi:hypothetical protein
MLRVIHLTHIKTVHDAIAYVSTLFLKKKFFQRNKIAIIEFLKSSDRVVMLLTIVVIIE